jgi:hypothetical protein
MDTSATQLWRINYEYQRRLQQAQTYLNLLEQLVLSRGAEAQALNALRRVRLQVESLAEEHRDWRYQFYYQSPVTRRMVKSHGDINRALGQFTVMRTHHEFELRNLYEMLLFHIQRPDPAMTRVPTGDLWTMTESAMHNLSGFEDYVQSLS